MIEQRRLPAGFVAGDFLRFERHEIEDVLGRLRRRLGGLSARIEASAFEPLRIAQVEIVVCVRLELNRCARGERLVDAPAGEVGCYWIDRVWNSHAKRRGTTELGRATQN